MPFAQFSRNGQILPIAQAVMPLTNIEYAYGFGVYENIRVVRGKPRFLSDHVERLVHSAGVIELDHPFSSPQITAWITALIAMLDPKAACNLKVLLLGAREPEKCQLVILPLQPLFPDKRVFARGATAITFHYERLFPQAKALNMFGSYIAYRKAKKAGCYDALLVDRHGCVTEGTRTNFFAIRGRTLHSPPLKDILEGVTRKHILAVAREAGFALVEENISLSSLPSFDGAFLTSTSSKVMPLRQIDAHEFAVVPMPELKELMQKFDAFLTQSEE